MRLTIIKNKDHYRVYDNKPTKLLFYGIPILNVSAFIGTFKYSLYEDKYVFNLRRYIRDLDSDLLLNIAFELNEINGDK